LIEPPNIRFFVGYSGWSSGQLSEELGYGSWVQADMDANYLFKIQPDKLWSQVMYNKGNLYEVIADLPEHMSWN
ncbi:MAG TPA: YqgE/AlgH family protein, partial [Saprospiraceae bacterium]|nr:YqgE/AlgH family protein [Saprospiraceae bacterium]